MNLKKVQCRWHRFSPAAFPQGRLLSSPTLGYQKYKPYRLGPPHILSPTRVNDIRTTSPTQTEYVGHAQSIPKRNQPSKRNPPKRNRRGGAYVPARTSAQRRFHAKITYHVWGLNDGCAPVGRHGRAHRRRPYPSPPNHAVCHYLITLYIR